MSAKTKIVITGMGTVTPVGIGVEDYWQGLLSGKCGIDEITSFDTSAVTIKKAGTVKGFEPKEYMPQKLTRDLDTFMQYAYASAQQAIAMSGIEKFDALRTGITMGTAMAGLHHTCDSQSQAENGKHIGPKFVSKVMGNICAAQLAIHHEIKGPSLTVSTACSSGGDAVTVAAMLIEAGAADTMVVMGGEAAICPLLIQSLGVSGALSKTGDSRPFDVERSGFVMGEGGGALILETEEHAKNRGAKIIAELAGYANNNDAFNPVAPEPEGDGAAECMKIALEKAGLSPEDIGYINAHGTATLKGDIAECKAVRKVFGKYDVPVSSTKGATGHLMGAGGITEFISCIKAVETGIIPPTAGCKTPDSECEANIVFGAPKSAKITTAMSNALGFGGQNSCLIVSKYGE